MCPSLMEPDNTDCGKDRGTKPTRNYQLIHHTKCQRPGGRIAVTSPLARAMIGKSLGDSVEVTAPGGSKSYEILEVKYK